MRADSRAFMAFDTTTPQPEAVQAFVKKYRQAPDDAFVRLGLLLVGPIPPQSSGIDEALNEGDGTYRP